LRDFFTFCAGSDAGPAQRPGGVPAPDAAADFRAGPAAARNFLKGQVMKLSKGQANPALAGEILERKLKA